MKHNVTLANGITVPALGQGTWYLGDDPAVREREIEAAEWHIHWIMQQQTRSY